MPSGNLKQPVTIKCLHCNTEVLWTGGRRRYYCNRTCRYKHQHPPKPPVLRKPLRQRQLSTQLKLDRGQCADCGLLITTQNVVCIDWDHRDPTTKQFTISYLIGRITDQQLIEEINKCQALCSNCHRIRTHNERHYKNDPHPHKTNRGSRQSLRHR